MRKRQTFYNNLLILFLISIVLPIVIMSVCLAYYFQNKIYEANKRYFSTSLYSISTNLSTYFSELQNLAMTPYVYDDISIFYTAVKKGNYTEEGSANYTVERYRQNYTTCIQRILITAREDILAISFAPANSNNQIMITTTKKKDFIDNTAYPYLKEAWYSDSLASCEPYYYTTSDSLPYLSTDTTVISTIHPVKNVYTKHVLGIIRIDASDKIIQDIFKNVALSKNSGFVIVNQDCQPVYQFGKIEQEIIPYLPTAKALVETSNDTYDLYCSDISGMPWRLIFVSSRKDTAKEIVVVWGLAILLSIASILIAYVIFRSNSKKTTLALNSILSTMEEVAHGNFDTNVPSEVLLKNDSFTTEEFSLIAENLNDMIKKLQLYIDKAYKYELNHKEAEYRALQSQVNPHFLYNTLNCFISMNRLGMKKELEDGIIQLTRLFRYTCSNEKLTTVQEELNCCIQYCNLMKIRFENKITFFCDIGEGAGEVEIPRLLFQPLVENAVKHGMSSDGRSISIWLDAYVQNGFLVMQERNNGVPINLNEVYAEGKVGIQNVESRVRIFHPDAQFKIELIDEITCITIQIPLGGTRHEHTFG